MWRVLEWKMSDTELSNYVQDAIESGITTFDHADVYGRGAVETLFGQALTYSPGLRHKLQLVSKASIRPANSQGVRIKHYDTSATYLRASVEQSLVRLKTDYLDLFLIHRPDPLACLGEIAEVAQALKQQGKIRAFGVSNYSPQQFDLLHARTALSTNQFECSPFETGAVESGMFSALAQADVSPMIWSPLGGGRLFSETDPVAVRVRETMKSVQQNLAASSWQAVAYAWLFRLPGTPYVIAGSRRKEALLDALEGVKLMLSREHWFAILEAARGQAVA
jgi:predicted oxidoreductase